MKKKEVGVSARKRKLLIGIWLIAFLGLGFSLELTRIYYRSYQDPNFNPICQISERVSCVSVALSKYSRFLGLPNSVYGLLVYFLVLSLIPFRLWSRVRIFAHLEIYLALLALISFGMTIYLAVVSSLILKTVCIWCTALYVVDTIFLVLALFSLDPPRRMAQQISEDLLLLRTDPRTLGVVLALVIGVLIFFVVQLNRSRAKYIIPPLNGPGVEIDIGGDPSFGPKRAPITIIEFSDFQCPYCREMHNVLRKIRKKYPKEVRIIFKNFPLDAICNPMVKHSAHPNSCLAAFAAECAYQMGSFEEFYENLINATNYQPNSIMELARESGLNWEEFQQCLLSGQVKREVQRDIEEARKLKISGTPLLIINGHSFPGFLYEEQLEGIIKQILEGKEIKSPEE